MAIKNSERPRVAEVELKHRSARYAMAICQRDYKTADPVKGSLIVNSVAHGYFIGFRHGENWTRPSFWTRLLRRFPGSTVGESLVFKEGQKAAKWYIKTNFKRIDTTDQALVESAIGIGFRQGMRDGF